MKLFPSYSLVKYGNVNYLKEKMRIILEDPQKSIEFIDNGKKFICEELSWENIVKNVEKNYENCIHHI